MAVLNNAFGLLLAPEAGGGGGYTIDRSVRFNSADSSYLSRTPASAGNRKTWTWSGWVKRSKLGATYEMLFSAGTEGTECSLRFSNGPADSLEFYQYSGGGFDWHLITTQLFRDVSAWYHIVAVVDSTQGTSSDRAKLYINGIQITSLSTASYPTSNYDSLVNSTIEHGIGRVSASQYFNGYLADIHFVDGQALTPSSFGEFDTNGIWQPKEYTGSYGTNGFHLPFSNNATSAALGTDTSGNNNTWTVNNISAATGGPTSVAASSGALPIYNTTDTYGTVKGTGTRTDTNNSSIVLAIGMDGANGGTTFTDESATIKGSGSAKSITVSSLTTSTAQSKYYGSSAVFSRASAPFLSIPDQADLEPGSGNFTIECWLYLNNSTSQYEGFFSKPGPSDQNGYIFYKETNSNITFSATTGGGNNWAITLNFGAASNYVNKWTHFAISREGDTIRGFANGVWITTSTAGGTIVNNDNPLFIGKYTLFPGSITYGFDGYMSDFRMYKGVAKYTSNFNIPTSTQLPTVAVGNDSLVDSPTNGSQTDTGVGGEVVGNYCTWNPLNNNGVDLSNGNLDVSNGAAHEAVRGTFKFPDTGKWYLEFTHTAFLDPTNVFAFGVDYSGSNVPVNWAGNGVSYIGVNSTTLIVQINGAETGIPASTSGAVLRIAYNADTQNLWLGFNGNWYDASFNTTGNPATGVNPTKTSVSNAFPIANIYQTTGSLNTGQRPFVYTAPSGFKALCTANLPTPAISNGRTEMDVALYTGNGGTQTISGLAFSPDFVWLKQRNTARDHGLYDIVRGASQTLISNAVNTEVSANGVSAFNSDGFTLGSNAIGNESGGSYITWTWNAGSSTVTNNSGTIASQVRANPAAGISIVTYSGNSDVNATVGHGLNSNPGLILIKGRNNTFYWRVYHSYFGTNATQGLYLNDNLPAASHDQNGGIKAITSSTFGFGTNGTNDLDAVNKTGINYVAYCFAPVAGFSAMGSYTGSTAPNFIHVGFTPAFIVMKRTDSGTESWLMTTRKTGPNPVGAYYAANASTQEQTTSYLDIVSNGFVHRIDVGWNNFTGGNYVYFAFAENPFKIARAV